MDPDECLKQLLAYADEVLQEHGDHNTELVEFMDKLYGLDQWLLKGGFMPKRWSIVNGSIFTRVDAALELLSLLLKEQVVDPLLYFAVPRVLEAVLRGTRLHGDESFDTATREGLQNMRLLWPNNHRFWKYVKVSDF